MAPITVAYLGDRILLSVPAEVTTLAGHRARQQVERWLGSKGRLDLGRVVEMTLTGDRLGEITTAEEYAQQASEGARVLYGPDSARFIANQELCLTRWLLEGVDEKSDRECTLGQPAPGVVRPLAFRPAASETTHPSAACVPSSRGRFVLAIEPDRALSLAPDPSHCSPDIRHFARDGERGWSVRWHPPASCAEPWAEPRVRIVEESGHEVANDDGDGIEVRRLDGEWRVSWLPNARELSTLGGRSFHFELRLESGRSSTAAHVERSEPIDPGCRSIVPP
jgi:hypothetical protein